MNQKQRNVLWLCAAAVFLMVAFPPCHVVNYAGVVIKSGYGFLLDLPVHFTSSGSVMPSVVDIKTLLVQIFGAAVVGGACFFAAANKKVD